MGTHHFSFPRVIEIIAVAIIIAIIVIFPSPLERNERLATIPPDDVITHARETYNIDNCINTISPKVVLGESKDGTDLRVAEGESVTNCFPEATFIPLTRTSETPIFLPHNKGTPLLHVLTEGGNMGTKVTVISAEKQGSIASSSALTQEAEKTATTSTSTLSGVGNDTQYVGGGGGGGAVVLTENQFEICRKEVFGLHIPDVVSDADATLMVECLSK